jgi:LytS/YehU family sensor histidine kinase
VGGPTATNAIKHGFEKGKSGDIEITLGRNTDQDVTVIVDNDGLPFPDLKYAAADGLGLELASRLMSSIAGCSSCHHGEQKRSNCKYGQARLTSRCEDDQCSYITCISTTTPKQKMKRV